jgi:hypothetical protein
MIIGRATIPEEAGADVDAPPPLVVVVASCEPIAIGDDDDDGE